MIIKIETKSNKPKLNKTKTKTKKKLEFAQKWLIGCIIISVIFTSMSYVLAWFDKNTVETLSITIIQTLWASTGVSFGGYTVLNSVRAVTSSVWGIPNNITDTNNINNNNNQTDISLANNDVILEDTGENNLRGV